MYCQVAHGLPFQDPVERTGMYQHPIIAEISNEVFFAHEGKEGPSFPKLFNQDGKGLSLVTMALIAAAVRNIYLPVNTLTAVTASQLYR